VFAQAVVVINGKIRIYIWIYATYSHICVFRCTEPVSAHTSPDSSNSDRIHAINAFVRYLIANSPSERYRTRFANQPERDPVTGTSNLHPLILEYSFFTFMTDDNFVRFHSYLY
jgi:hypothetical protein